MSQRTVRAARVRYKALVEFDLNPPRCGNCEHFTPPVYGVPGITQYQQPSCRQADFLVKPHSLCNDWVSADGITLEQTNQGDLHASPTSQ